VGDKEREELEIDKGEEELEMRERGDGWWWMDRVDIGGRGTEAKMVSLGRNICTGVELDPV
jgi:hypothetical protein